jgi:hypothetical protein
VEQLFKPSNEVEQLCACVRRGGGLTSHGNFIGAILMPSNIRFRKEVRLGRGGMSVSEVDGKVYCCKVYASWVLLGGGGGGGRVHEMAVGYKLLVDLLNGSRCMT